MRKIVLAALCATMLAGSAQAAATFTFNNIVPGRYTLSYYSRSSAIPTIGGFTIPGVGFADINYDVDVDYTGTYYYAPNMFNLPIRLSSSDNQSFARIASGYRLNTIVVNVGSAVLSSMNYYRQFNPPTLGGLNGSVTISFAEVSPTYGLNISDVALTAVPEPAAWTMMIAGFGVIGYRLRRRKAAAGLV